MTDKFVSEKEHQSRIVSLSIKNFMSIKDALIEFDDSNVITLCGYNDSGKSAITRLLEVLFYNSYTTDQVKFITDGETYWSGILTFSDGIVYKREKYSDGKSLWELSKDGKILYTNRLENGTLAALSDIPEVIEKYLGVISDELTDEELNVRRNTDKLFLINTSGGDNYKILNSVLRSDVLASASKKLNDDKNKLNSEVQHLETMQEMLKDEYNAVEVAPKKDLDELDGFISNLEETFMRQARLKGAVDSYIELSGISVYDELTPIPLEKISYLQNIMQLAKEKDIDLYDRVDSVDTARLVDLQNIMNLYQEKSKPIYDSVSSVEMSRLRELQEIMKFCKILDNTIYEELSPIEVNRVKDIKEIAEMFVDYSGKLKQYRSVIEQLQNMRTKLDMLSKQYGLKVCKNCGSIVS